MQTLSKIANQMDSKENKYKSEETVRIYKLKLNLRYKF